MTMSALYFLLLVFAVLAVVASELTARTPEELFSYCHKTGPQLMNQLDCERSVIPCTDGWWARYAVAAAIVTVGIVVTSLAFVGCKKFRQESANMRKEKEHGESVGRESIKSSENAKEELKEEGTKCPSNNSSSIKKKGMNKEDSKEQDDEAGEMVRMLAEKLNDLRAAKRSTYEDKYHIEGHIRKLKMLRGTEQRREMEQVRKCCLPNMEDSKKKARYSQPFDRRARHTSFSASDLRDDPFVESVPLRMRRDESQYPLTKFETLTKRQKKNLEKEIRRVIETHNSWKLLKCPRNATNEEVWSSYHAYLRNWISKYGSFNFHCVDGYKDVSTVLTKMTTSYLLLVTSGQEKIVMQQILATGQVSSVPVAWGITKKLESIMKDCATWGSAAVEEREQAITTFHNNERIEMILLRKNDPEMRKLLARLMWEGQLPKGDFASVKVDDIIEDSDEDTEDSEEGSDDEETTTEDTKEPGEEDCSGGCRKGK